MSEAINWKAIYEMAKKVLSSGNQSTASSIIKGSGKKKPLKKGGAKLLKGGNKFYPCWICHAAGYKGGKRTPAGLKNHLDKVHAFSAVEAKSLAQDWAGDDKFQVSDIKNYNTDEEKRQFLKTGKVLKPEELLILKKKGNKEAGAVVNSIESTLETELNEQIQETAAEKAEREIREGLEKVKKEDRERQDKIAKEAKEVKEPGIAEVVKLMKGQIGLENLPAEPSLAPLGVETVKKIKQKRNTKAAKADASNIAAKFKNMEKSKLKRNPLVPPTPKASKKKLSGLTAPSAATRKSLPILMVSA